MNLISTGMHTSFHGYVQVNFAYKEAGEHKQALVKLRLCPKHALQLNHKQNHKLIKKRKREQQDMQHHIGKERKQSIRNEASTGLADQSNTNISGSGHTQAPDAGQASKAFDRKLGTNKHHDEVFDGLFD